MRSKAELLDRMKEYKGAEYIYTENGYIAWQMSTGDNYEIIFIEVRETRKGYGTELLRRFVEQVPPPYHSVFVVRLAQNESAGYFYRHMGFKETKIEGLYKGDDAVLAHITWKDLCQRLSTI